MERLSTGRFLIKSIIDNYSVKLHDKLSAELQVSDGIAAAVSTVVLFRFNWWMGDNIKMK